MAKKKRGKNVCLASFGSLETVYFNIYVWSTVIMRLKFVGYVQCANKQCNISWLMINIIISVTVVSIFCSYTPQGCLVCCLHLLY